MNRDFKGIWIPKEIWLNKDLTVMEKLFLVEIDSLDNAEGCFASNKHFAAHFGISKGRCTQIIKSLERKKIISVTVFYEGKTISKRVVRILTTLVNKLNYPSEKIKHPYLENAQESNTSINNTIEGNARAIDFFKKESPARFESWMMKNKKRIKNFVKFINHFNNKFDEEELKYTVRIIEARLSRFADNWSELERKDQDKNNNVSQANYQDHAI